jgi:uncharacterized protein YukE
VTSAGFRVDPDALLKVADQVHRLWEDLSGAASTAGSMPTYRDQANADVLRAALKPFWDGDDVFADAYKREHDGIVSTMSSMVRQLAELEKACRTTAAKYQGEDTSSKTTVTHSAPGGW